MPASLKIDTPTEFAQWAQTKTLFDDGTTTTATHVTNGNAPGSRLAYGKSPEGFWFFISMTPAEEPAFWQAHRDWISRNQAGHHASIVAYAPPASCGTPNTPPCEAKAIADPIGVLALEANASQAVKAA